MSAQDFKGTVNGITPIGIESIASTISDGDTTHAPDGNSVFDALALKAPLQLVANSPIKLVAALADQEYTGANAEAGVGGATLAFGTLIYENTDASWYKADADAAATTSPRLGFCAMACATAGATIVLGTGCKIRADSLFPTGTVGAPAYASGTAGEIQVAPLATGQFQRQVGFFKTADEFYIDIEPGYWEIA